MLSSYEREPPTNAKTADGIAEGEFMINVKASFRNSSRANPSKGNRKLPNGAAVHIVPQPLVVSS